MVYHGITYSHSGLTDPAVMPGYVAITKWRHEQTLKWTDLNPQLPEWSQVAKWFADDNWDLGKDMQAFARPIGTERTMIYKADTRMWVPRPREPQPAPKKKGKAKAKSKTKPTKPEKEKEPSAKRKKRRSVVKDENHEVVNVKKEASESDAEEEEAQENAASESKAEEQRPRVAVTSREKTTGVVLKRAADPEVKEKADALLGEKAPHSPVDPKSEEESAPGVDEDPYAKAPHGESDDEEDLEAELRSLGGPAAAEALQ